MAKDAWYLVKWSDESFPPSWQLDRDITDALKHEYHITHTLKGTRRKRATSLTDVFFDSFFTALIALIIFVFMQKSI